MIGACLNDIIGSGSQRTAAGVTAGRVAIDHEVAIIGTGFSGMAAAIALDRAGISDFVLLEKGRDIGGTWRDNQYPGACCDVPSHLYSFSFALNPGWSRRYSPAAEIHAYQRDLVHDFDLCDRIRGGFEAASARLVDGVWTVRSTAAETVRCRYLVSAIGALHIPNKPRFDGLDRYRGKVMHSAEWDHEFDWSGKRAVVVGSAASAVQIVPQLAETAARVTVMQRSANWFMPRRDRAITRFEHRLFRSLPFAQRLFRWRQYLVNDLVFHANFRKRRSLRKWLVHRLVHRHLAKSVRDPELRQKLTPDYPIGCKRVLLSDDFLPALQRDNVELVTDPVGHFTEDALVTATGREIKADLVVLATGFQSTKLFGDMEITGPDGRTLADAWAEEIRAHRTVAVSGFPNFFMMYGPNSNLGHSSIILMIEAQADYLARLLRHAVDGGAHTVEPRPEAEAAWNEFIRAGLDDTVWPGDCRSWYKDARGQVFSLWPHGTTRFIRAMRRAPLEEYRFYS
jgi:cation diffusion facilitator CzcD-associated flavoprotein CzcO